MENIDKLYCHRPCGGCPFLKGTKMIIEHRIKDDLNSDNFICHKTGTSKTNPRKQCAGHMILMKNENRFVEMAELMNISLDLNGQDLVFESKEDCIKHHKQNEE